MYVTSKAVERAVSLLDVLTKRPHGITRDEIRFRVPGYDEAGTDSAFERMFERDKQVLRALGSDLVTERVPFEESGFIYRLENSPGRSPDFTPAERALLATASLAWEGTELERTARTALLKIEAGRSQFPEQASLSARFVDRVGLSECLSAVADGKALRFRYRSHAQSPRTVVAWGVGMRFGHWYVEGWDKGKKASRLFRLDRMVGLTLVTAEGPAAPETYSIADSLAGLEPDAVPLLATTIHPSHGGRSQHRWGEDVRALPSFGLEESVLQAVMQGRTHFLPPSQALPEGVDSGYQDAAAEAEAALRLSLGAWHGEPYACDMPVKTSAWKPVAPQRVRESASDQLIRLLTMVAVVQTTGGMNLGELADLFDTTPTKARNQLEGLAASVGFESLNLSIDDDLFVEVGRETSLSAGVKLTEVEVLVLSLALDLMKCSHGSGLGNLVRAKLWDSLGDADGKALNPHCVAVAPVDINPLLRQALDQKIPLEILYRSRRGETVRVIEPLKLIVNNGPKYVVAWCRKAQGYRHFSLDSITTMTLCEDETFSDRLDDLGETGTWLSELKAGRHPSELMVLALDGEQPSHVREAVDLELRRYSTATAQAGGWQFYKVPLANQDWALSLVVRLGPTVRILHPAHLIPKVQELLSLPPGTDYGMRRENPDRE
ncbi:helix-turn-helix transcriptional regulator [Rothia nasimurium]|uniref:helix-turn-helix transcriptional regulator n=2 Tax=Rothia nasimurium TaxID=85336 RepID=UPI003017AE74